VEPEWEQVNKKKQIKLMPTSAAGSGGIAASNGGSKKENVGKGNSMTSITKFLVPRIGGIVPEEETNALVLVCGDLEALQVPLHCSKPLQEKSNLCI
jgi:hypothetical protein